jgi:hypothetical protein
MRAAILSSTARRIARSVDTKEVTIRESGHEVGCGARHVSVRDVERPVLQPSVVASATPSVHKVRCIDLSMRVTTLAAAAAATHAEILGELFRAANGTLVAFARRERVIWA